MSKGLVYEEKRCIKCGLSANIEGTNIGEDCVCELCKNWDAKIDVVSHDLNNAAEIIKKSIEIVQMHKNTNNNFMQYDAIVLYSGGKDSTYMLGRLSRDVGLRVLAVTVDNWFLSKEVLDNQKKVMRVLGVDHLVIRPSWEDAKKMFYTSAYKAADEKYKVHLSKFGLFCWPCFSLIYASVCQLAKIYGISIIAGGWSPGQINAGKHSERGDGLIDFAEVVRIYVEPFSRMLSSEGIDSKYKLPCYDDAKGIYLLPFFNYWPYDENEVISYITDELGWRRPMDTDGCSSNCMLNSLDRILFRREFGYDRYEIQQANMVRTGHVNRQSVIDVAHESLDISSVQDVIEAIGLEELVNNKI